MRSTSGSSSLAVAFRTLLRFSAIAALSGKPETLDRLSAELGHEGSDDNLVMALQQFVVNGETFFRGGQAHGSLKKECIHDAARSYMSQHLTLMTENVTTWVCEAGAAPEVRVKALRLLMAAATESALIFGMRDYFSKRFMEIVLLGLLGLKGSFPLAITVCASDLDALADCWPVAGGTAAGIKLIFPTARGAADLRQCLRVLQRALGRGRRCVPLVRVSAFLCFWQGSLKGTYNWAPIDPSEFQPLITAAATEGTPERSEDDNADVAALAEAAAAEITQVRPEDDNVDALALAEAMGIHPSHLVSRDQYGIVACWKCGSLKASEQMRDLLKECPGHPVGDNKRKQLQNLKKGRPLRIQYGAKRVHEGTVGGSSKKQRITKKSTPDEPGGCTVETAEA